MHLRGLFFFSLAALLIVRVLSSETRENLNLTELFNQVFNVLPFIRSTDLLKFMPNLKINNRSTSAESETCFRQVELLTNSMKNGTMWALQMADASSKIPSGILMGNHIDLGMYDECVEIEAITNGEEIRGRHCMYKVATRFDDKTLQETLSICLPLHCGPEDVEIILQEAFDRIKDFLPSDTSMKITGTTCSTPETVEWGVGEIVTLLFLGMLLVFLGLCTIFDGFVRSSNNDCSSHKLIVQLSRFSVYSNAINIFNMKKTANNLPAINGLRFFSMCWVIFGHEYFIDLFAATINTLKYLPWSHSWGSLYIMIATFAVDTFFTISGFLISYLFLKEMSTGRRFNILTYYIHRYLRLTPALAALLILSIFILPHLGSGALWQQSADLMVEHCQYNWWPTLLYVHNYVQNEHLWCLAHTWYLAVEMHFFWLSPLVLYPLAKKPKIGLSILALFFIASVITPTVIAYQNEYSAVPFATAGVNISEKMSTEFYMQSHNRASPYLIGIYLGYLIFVAEGHPKKMCKWIGWLLCILGFAFSFFTMRVFQASDYEYELAWEIFYIGASKPIWSSSVSWIIYASVRGFGGPISAILSLPIYQPFSRISYSVYLVHMVIQIMRISSARTSRFFSQLTCFTDFLTDFALSIIIGFVFTIIFESPVITLEKMITKRDWKNLPNSKREFGRKNVENGIDNPGLMKD